MNKTSAIILSSALILIASVASNAQVVDNLILKQSFEKNYIWVNKYLPVIYSIKDTPGAAAFDGADNVVQIVNTVNQLRKMFDEKTIQVPAGADTKDDIIKAARLAVIVGSFLDVQQKLQPAADAKTQSKSQADLLDDALKVATICAMICDKKP